jgi:hypothetical protein
MEVNGQLYPREYRRIILKWISEKYYGRMTTEFNWIKINSNGGLFLIRYQPSRLTKCEEFV